MHEYDSEYLLTDLATAQELYAVPNEVHGIAIRLQDPSQARVIGERIKARLGGGIRVLSWMDHNQRLFAAVAVERRVMSFLLFFVMAVAALGFEWHLNYRDGSARKIDRHSSGDWRDPPPDCHHFYHVRCGGGIAGGDHGGVGGVDRF